MRRLLMAVAVIVAVVMVAGVASAALLGIRDQLGWPDIFADTSGQIKYYADTDTFILTARDRTITYADGTYEDLDSTGYVAFVIEIKVDESGNLVGTGTMKEVVTGGYMTDIKIYLTVDKNGNLVGTGTMVEKVVKGSVTVSGNTYSAGTILLSGTVVAFGWGEGDNLGDFDFLISKDSLSGALVNDGIWPTTWPTGIVAYADDIGGWAGSWDSDFTLYKVKGDKAPVPEPTTLFLLGTGLIGLAGIGRRKLRKVKREM